MKKKRSTASAASCTPRAAGDESFKEIQKRFGLDGALELIALNGYYTLMAMVLNTAGLPLPARGRETASLRAHG